MSCKLTARKALVLRLDECPEEKSCQLIIWHSDIDRGKVRKPNEKRGEGSAEWRDGTRLGEKERGRGPRACQSVS